MQMNVDKCKFVIALQSRRRVFSSLQKFPLYSTAVSPSLIISYPRQPLIQFLPLQISFACFRTLYVLMESYSFKS